jgi:Membrane protease subunits, stomatin/prohibitin homologs
MFITLTLAVLALVAIGALGYWLFVPFTRIENSGKYGESIKVTRHRSNPYAFWTSVALLAVFFITLVFACTSIVGTRKVGVVTQWSRPTGETLNNGLHFVLPWTAVHEMDAAIQNDVYKGDTRIQVRLCNSSTAFADANVRWQMKQDAADELFVQYKDFDNVRSNLVERNLRTALNEAFTSCFDPLSSDTAKNDLPGTVVKAKEKLQALAGNQVEILDVSVPIIDYDDQTEQRINAINQSRADTTKAEQETKTAEQKRKAAEILSGQPVPDLKIAIAACVNKMAETGQSLNCFPIGSSVLPTLSVPNPAG